MATVTRIDPTNLTLQSYEAQDSNLISQFDVNSVLTGSSYIEFFVYDNNKNLLYTTYNYNSYTVLNDGQSAGNNNEVNNFNISPGDDVENQGFDQGEYLSYYNFLTKQIGDPNTNLFIQEISSDRTEIRLDSNILSNLDIVEQTNNFIQFRDDSTYFVDFYLNLGDNDLIIANNIQLEDATTNDPTILVKLYEPLPSQFELKDQLWIVTTLNEPEAFNVNFPPQPIEFIDFTNLSGPNFNIPIKDQVNNSTQNLSYTDLISGAPTSSLDQLNSLMDSSSLSISVDYTDFTEFIHFSSAQTRLENFYYKVQLITGYSASIASLTNVTSSATSTTILQSKISEITKNFDKYEYFLYYNSGSSYSWPKTTTEPPYLLATTGSTTVLNWFGSVNEQSSNYGGLILSASNYDDANKDQLLKSIPEYLREDAANRQYDLFVDMVAQYYDNVWIYTKDVTQKYNADNRLDFGVSKDLVSDAIKDFGVKLYQNNFSKDDLYTAFLGLTPGGALFPFPEITSSLPTPTGFEYVDTLISASNDIIPLDDVNKSLYKRIYHNIPYLLKSKGTIAGLRALITSYGIPDTILKISEFGGKDKVNENDWDYYFNKFNYAWDTQGSNDLFTSWMIDDTKWEGYYDNNGTQEPVPRTLQFRFKTENITSDVAPNYGLLATTQSLWSIQNPSNGLIQSSIRIEYTGSGLTTGSYSGSIKDPYYQYGTLKYINNSGASSSLYLPFFDGGWWSVMATVDSDGSASLYSGNKIYNGKDGTSLGYYSSSLPTPAEGWSARFPRTSSFAKSYSQPGLGLVSNFSGSIQEIRYYSPTISESVFKDYIMNPLSIEGNSTNSSPNELLFRAALGSELDTSTNTAQTSIHPKITGSWTTTSSFIANSTYNFQDPPSYSTNTEYYFLDQFPAGIKNRITDKIRYEDNVVPAGDTLSPYRRVTQATEASASYTENINYLEVAFSPQNEINDDIVSQLGYFNIGDYIGDPRQRSSSLDYYPDLNNLSEAYFEKYIKNYDLVDFVRLIKFFDNSLFKMIKDFVPARTSLASGIVIKQHLLERNKYPQPQVSYTDELLTGSIDIGDIEGGPGGMLNIFNGLSTSPSGTLGAGPDNRFDITQSWEESYTNLFGSVTKTNDSQHEFYDGEFSGSCMLITNGELNSECDEFKNISTTSIPYTIRFYTIPTDTDGFTTNKNTWLSDNNQPLDGYISILYNSTIPTKPLDDPKGALYLKIPKIDGNGVDQSTSLESLTQIIIPEASNNVTYQFTSVTEKPTFYLYDVEPNTASPNIYGKLNYDFTGSIDVLDIYYAGPVNKAKTQTSIVSGSNDQYGFYSLTDQEYTFNTYAQKDLYLRITGSVAVQSEDAVIGIYRRTPSQAQANSELLTGSIFSAGSTHQFDIPYNLSSSTPGDTYFLGIQKNQFPLNFTNFTTCSFSVGTKFFITSSAASATSSVDSVLEPYFSSDFSRALDCQPLLNNVQGERPNPFLQDLDYNTSQTVPINYQAVVSESATKATVPESNYTQLSSTNIRYNGSKSTSKVLNKWSFGDKGGFGKLPTIDSTQVYVAYCDSITSSIQERMDTSAAHIKYLIKDDGTVVIPNTTPNSLEINKYNFVSREQLNLSSQTGGTSTTSFTKEIYRGGSRIEPIIYNQNGNYIDGGMTFDSTIELTDQNLFGGVLEDFQYKTSRLQTSTPQQIIKDTWTNVVFDTIVADGNGNITPGYDNGTQTYVVDPASIAAGVDLTFHWNIMVSVYPGTLSSPAISYYQIPAGQFRARLVDPTSGPNYTVFGEITLGPAGTLGSSGTDKARVFKLEGSFTVDNQDLVDGQQYRVQVLKQGGSNGLDGQVCGYPGTNPGANLESPTYASERTYFEVQQNPAPTTIIDADNLFIKVTDDLYTSSYQGIYTTSSNFISAYGFDNIQQSSIPNSGFIPISSPLEFTPGDEFRFEGLEDKVYMIERVSLDPLPFLGADTSSLFIYLNKPVNPDNGVLNINEFLVRRYADDASSIIFKGEKPLGSTGPYILSPEYISPDLDKDIDTFITDLTEKNLLP